MEIEAALEQLRTAAGIRGLQWLRRRMEAVLESAGAAIVPPVGHERWPSPERLSPEELHPTRQQLKSPPRGDAAILPLVSQEQRSPPEHLGPEEPPPTTQRTESPSGDDAAIVSLASQERRSAPERLSSEEPPPTRQQLKSPPRGDAAILPLVSQEQRSPPERLSPEEPPPTQRRQKIASKIVAVIAPPVSLKRRSPPERLSSKEAPPTRKRRESPSKADATIVPSASRERRSPKRLSSKEASRSRSRRESPSKADAAIVPSVNRERRSPKRLSSKETSRSRSRRESPSKADAAIVPSVNRERRSPKRLSSKEASRSRSGRESRSREPQSRVTHSSRESRSRRSPTRCKDSAEGGRPRSEKARSRTRQASDGEQDTAGSSASDVPVEELPCQPSEKSEAEKACGPTDDQINSQRVSGGGQQSAGPEAQGRSSSPRTEVTASDTAASSQTVQMLGGSPVMEVEAVVTSQCDHQDPETTASVVTAPMPSGRRPALVWIFGHSYVHRSADAAKNYPTGRQLGISQDYATVRWIGTRGMLWREVLPEVHRFARLDRPPDILVLDVGGNDLGIRPFRELTRDIRYDILRLLSSFPGLIIVFSELTIRKTWHNARSADGINKARIKINRVISPFVDQNGGVAVRHRDLEKGQGDYWLDNGIDLNAAGINIWALAIKEGIEKALLLWRASQA